MGQISKWPLGGIESPNGLVVAANAKRCSQWQRGVSMCSMLKGDKRRDSAINRTIFVRWFKWLKHLAMLKWLQHVTGCHTQT